jgi:hypothetical protein
LIRLIGLNRSIGLDLVEAHRATTGFNLRNLINPTNLINP